MTAVLENKTGVAHPERKRKRSKFDIHCEILASIIDAGDKALSRNQIMYRVYTSFSLVNEYLWNLSEKGLVTRTLDHKYFITAKGREYFSQIEKLRSIEEKGD